MKRIITIIVLLTLLINPTYSARLFNDAADDHLIRANTLGLSAYPYSVSAWFNSEDKDKNQTIFCFSDPDAATDLDFEMLYIRDDPDNDLLAFTDNADTLAFIDTTATYTANSWNHALGVWAGNQERYAYLNGSGESNVADNLARPGNMDSTQTGIWKTNGNNVYYPFDGMIGEVAVWNAALTAAEAATLAKGYSPLLVKPQNLVAYWTLVRGLNDRVGAYNMTADGTSVAVHPRVIYP